MVLNGREGKHALLCELEFKDMLIGHRPTNVSFILYGKSETAGMLHVVSMSFKSQIPQYALPA